MLQRGRGHENFGVRCEPQDVSVGGGREQATKPGAGAAAEAGWRSAFEFVGAALTLQAA